MSLLGKVLYGDHLYLSSSSAEKDGRIWVNLLDLFWWVQLHRWSNKSISTPLNKLNGRSFQHCRHNLVVTQKAYSNHWAASNDVTAPKAERISPTRRSALMACMNGPWVPLPEVSLRLWDSTPDESRDNTKRPKAYHKTSSEICPATASKIEYLPSTVTRSFCLALE